ncbi:MAG: hypothetical protein JWN43_253, partial [Gammaproteobacteria bacterium]|nr:hypothetical protein [Gammaproteobacteria bacterium]
MTRGAAAHPGGGFAQAPGVSAEPRRGGAPSRGGRILPALTLLLTAGLLLWAHWLARDGSTHGLTPIFFFLFASHDTAALECALLIGLAAALVSKRYRVRPLLRWLGSNPGWVAAGSLALLSCGAWMVYLHSPLSMDEYAPYFQSRVFAAGHL